ncbi:hypothetical protein ACWDG9_41000 [Streptomyces sp. NPDC001073]
MTDDRTRPGRELLLALTNAVEGKEEEFEKWYWGTHIPEILELPGFVAARPYRAAGPPEGAPHRYVTVYEVEGSAEEARTLLFTAGLGFSETIDLTSVVMLPLTPGADEPAGA